MLVQRIGVVATHRTEEPKSLCTNIPRSEQIVTTKLNPVNFKVLYLYLTQTSQNVSGRRGRDRMVVGCIPTYALSAYQQLTMWACIPLIEKRTWYNIIIFCLSVTCDRSVVFSGNSSFLSSKTDCHDMTKILLKVALNSIALTITITLTHNVHNYWCTIISCYRPLLSSVSSLVDYLYSLLTLNHC